MKWLDEKEFYELCQAYRMAYPEEVSTAFKALQERIREECAEYALWACAVDAESGPR